MVVQYVIGYSHMIHTGLQMDHASLLKQFEHLDPHNQNTFEAKDLELLISTVSCCSDKWRRILGVFKEIFVHLFHRVWQISRIITTLIRLSILCYTSLILKKNIINSNSSSNNIFYLSGFSSRPLRTWRTTTQRDTRSSSATRCWRSMRGGSTWRALIRRREKRRRRECRSWRRNTASILKLTLRWATDTSVFVFIRNH